MTLTVSVQCLSEARLSGPRGTVRMAMGSTMRISRRSVKKFVVFRARLSNELFSFDYDQLALLPFTQRAHHLHTHKLSSPAAGLSLHILISHHT